ncbi:MULTISPECIES: hypothetical protein [unclassified Arthrobacter]|uniref:hypothetical protein n=1 Tax=unclassified Arthrobacter TaxID=235627 RepID=UPI0014870C0C|nr:MULTISPECIES: hypothetical protein [unclassified Arthrobacter]
MSAALCPNPAAKSALPLPVRASIRLYALFDDKVDEGEHAILLDGRQGRIECGRYRLSIWRRSCW